MISPNTASSSDVVTYYIAQHTADLFRRESRNIGVVVEKQGHVTARFLGERLDGDDFDNRSLKTFQSPKAYRLWVRHWRKTITKHPTDWQSRLLESDGGNFLMIPGGEVAATGADSAYDVCGYLYSLLVSEGGLREALGGDDEDEAQIEITNEVRNEFKSLGIMKSAPRELVRHPVFEPYNVRGTRLSHPVTFYQERRNEAWAIEPINFATRQKSREQKHAGSAAYIFSDIRQRNASSDRQVHTVAIVRATAEDRASAAVEYSLGVLHDTSDRVVDWLEEKDKRDFLAEHNAIALSA